MSQGSVPGRLTAPHQSLLHPGFSERSDMGSMEYIQEDAPEWMYPNTPSGQNATLTARMVSVRLPPKPQFKFVQDNQVG